jgi:hypothetical protein
MSIKTDFYIFGKEFKEVYLEELNSVIENGFKVEENKAVSVLPFFNISKENIEKIAEICKKNKLRFLSSWFSDDLGYGFYLFIEQGKIIEMNFSLLCNVEKSEEEFVSFCGMKEEWEFKEEELESHKNV